MNEVGASRFKVLVVVTLVVRDAVQGWVAQHSDVQIRVPYIVQQLNNTCLL